MAFAKQLCRRTFGKTMITSLRQRDGMRGFIDTFIVYNNIASVKQLLQYGSRTSIDTFDTKFYNTFDTKLRGYCWGAHTEYGSTPPRRGLMKE